MTNHLRGFVAPFVSAVLVAAICLSGTSASAGMVPKPASVGSVFEVCIATHHGEMCGRQLFKPETCAAQGSSERPSARAKTACPSASEINPGATPVAADLGALPFDLVGRLLKCAIAPHADVHGCASDQRGSRE